MITPATLTRHELNGLPVRVADAPNPDLVGIAGRVVSETTNTLVIRPTRFPTARSAVVESSATGGSTATAERSAADESGVATGDRSGPRTNRATDRGRATDKRVPKRGTTFEFVVPTDEAASGEPLGSAVELPWETVGTGRSRPADKSGGCETVGYVTVDGARLVARPARRTERAGDTLWQSD